ncbi:hypothetical protein EMCRGX_G009028 [Ephydatia muelleri]
MMSEETAPPAKRLCTEDIECSEPGEQIEKADDTADIAESKGGKCNAKKCALLLAYSGKGYLGMQWNPGVRTIEHDLIKALSDANAVPEHAKGNPGKARLLFQRCARTDKGVSAARQLVSLKMFPLERYVDEINRHLPPEIRVIALKRVTKGFTSNGHQACSARSYEYVLPTFAFAPFHATRVDYRITDQLVDRINVFLRQYEGTHNFHNFTSGKEATETSAKRYIMSFKCGNRFVASAECDECPQKKEVEFISLHVQGQSFMIHQIRKMIGLLIAIVKGYIPEGSITRAYTMERAEIPKAPGIGLLLDNASGQQDFPLSPLSFPLPLAYPSPPSLLTLSWTFYPTDTIQAFKRDYIYKTIIETEIKELSMMHWLSSLLKHDFTYYLKPEQSQTPAPESQMQQSQATVSCDMQESQASVSCDMQSQASVSCDMQESQATVSCDMQSQASAVSCDMQESQASVSCDMQSQASVPCDMQSQASVSCDMQSQASAVSCDMQESQASVSCDLQQTQDSSSCDILRDHSPVAEQETLSEKNTPF